MSQGQATDAAVEISLYVHRYTASAPLAGGAGGTVRPHGVDAPRGHQTAGRLAWPETFPTAGGRWQRAPHQAPTRHTPSPGAGVIQPRSAARPGNGQNVLPVFSQRSCLCVSWVGFLKRACSGQGQDSVMVQPRPPPRAWRAALPGLYGLLFRTCTNPSISRRSRLNARMANPRPRSVSVPPPVGGNKKSAPDSSILKEYLGALCGNGSAYPCTTKCAHEFVKFVQACHPTPHVLH